MVDDVGKDSDGLNSSPTMVNRKILAVNKDDNMQDENDGLTPSKSTAYLQLREIGLMWLFRW
ncbi:hypothetical protein Tco_0354320, partial [Tanacetum coccineum]